MEARMRWKRSSAGLSLALALVAGPIASQAHVTRVVVAPAALSGPAACPLQQMFIAQITSTVAGKVRFQWTTSDGQHSPVQEAIFDSAGTRPVSYLWLATSTGPAVSGWVRVRTSAPNAVTAVARVSVTCTR
jgi:hypothetical protein